jgi:dolichol-phosphate mannosyltransferase
MLLSVVVPCFNEEAVLEETHRRLTETLAALGQQDYEVLYVDDGSRDATPMIHRRLHERDARVRVLRFSRNFGHQVAVSAGLEHAAGDAVVIIDADLQDPPEVIGDMLARWREGFDVAYGLRTDRAGETSFKRATATVFYRILNRLSDTEIPQDVGDFRLLDRRVVDALLDMPERARFIRGMVSWVGYRQIGVPYRRAPRFGGETKYPFFKMLRLATDGLTSFSLVPLRLASLAGLTASCIALLGIVYALGVRLLTSRWVAGWAALFVAVLFVGGIQLLALGIIGEYVGRTYAEVKHRPLYLLQERLGFHDEGDGRVARPARMSGSAPSSASIAVPLAGARPRDPGARRDG